MRIRETVCVDYDSNGRMVKRTCTIDIDDPTIGRNYDNATVRGFPDTMKNSSFKQIFEAFEDYCNSRKWG